MADNDDPCVAYAKGTAANLLAAVEKGDRRLLWAVLLNTQSTVKSYVDALTAELQIGA